MAVPKAKASIMIVDDLPSNIQILSEILGKEYSVFFALNGMDALEQVKMTRPDLILLDIVMPGISGLEVCRRLKEDPRMTDIPVIFITALDHPEEEQEGLKLGAADYISKPFNPDIVQLRVSNHIELKMRTDALKERTRELEDALSSIKRLKGLLPICSSCKKIRNDKGYWKQIEEYFSENSDIMFSHGLCPKCIKKLYPDISIPDMDDTSTNKEQ